MRRGAIHWVDLDKRRPAVIISPAQRNEGAGDVIVLPCSSRIRPMPWHVLLQPPEGGLRDRTMVKCEQVMTVPKHSIHPVPLGRELSAHRMRQIEWALLSALGITLLKA